MSSVNAHNTNWQLPAEDDDHPSAESYLSLVDGPDQVRAIFARFKTAPVTQF